MVARRRSLPRVLQSLLGQVLLITLLGVGGAQAVQPVPTMSVVVPGGAVDPFTPPVAAKPGRHGPFRTDPSEGIPRHAYSPFDDLDKPKPYQPRPQDCVPGRILLKVKAAFPLDDAACRAALEARLSALGVGPLQKAFRQPARLRLLQGVAAERLPQLERWFKARLKPEANPLELAKQLVHDPDLAVAEPDFVRKPVGELPGPDTDPMFTNQWHLAAARVPEAWAWLDSQGLPAGGNRDVVVAVIDTGVDITHPDLAANVWTNSREIAGDGIDNDGNGFIDDVHGCNVVSDSSNHSGNPMDDHGHGTHVAGIIAAQGMNDLGVVGVAYNAQVMPIKAAQYSGVLAASDIAEAINYAVAQGADIINMSFGGYARSQIEEDALAVAFGQCVLVAAAGNDGIPNEKACSAAARAMYPAAYNWVLGVMASDRIPGDRNWLTLFSNWDCVPQNTMEYELMAPGVDVWSTLPTSQYAAWDGTSMAAPIVSGIAALARTTFADKDIYSSRFIMGQMVANAGPVANAVATLTVAPKPELAYLEHWLFDTTNQAAIDDNDGVVDAGEIVDLAIVIRNHWGKADQTTVTLEAWAQGGVGPDPYVTMLTNMVDYGAVGSFGQDDNGLVYDAQQTVVGVRQPFRFSVSADCPNDHLIPLRLTMSARNGLDPADSATYTFRSDFHLLVQRGRELPRIISEDMTLTKDFFWILPDQTRIQPGATVSITEGTQVQFWSTHPDNPYGLPPNAYLDVQGSLVAIGTASEPIELFTGLEGSFQPVTIRPSGSPVRGTADLEYVMLDKPDGDFRRLDHCYLSESTRVRRSVYAAAIRKTRVHKLMTEGRMGFGDLLEETLFDCSQVGARSLGQYTMGSMTLYTLPTATRGNVFLDNYQKQGSEIFLSVLGVPALPQGQTSVVHNAFLNALLNPDIDYWLWVSTRYGDTYVQDNYWGTTSRTLIEAAIFDYQDRFEFPRIYYEPVLTNAPVDCYPFVVDASLKDAEGNRVARIGAEEAWFWVTFNRDMSVAVQPQVSFGPDVPMTDYTVHAVDGGWQDPRTWVGTFNITPITGDGYQLIRVAGAVAADDPWLVTGDDAGRFRFEIITSGTESMNLQATGAEGWVNLSWMQDDFDLLAGYHLYRSTDLTNGFARINPTIIPPQRNALADTNVTPGQPYYYKFTVVKSDMSESDFSNVAQATPLDTIPPVISHTPLTSATPGLPLTLFAHVTDNVGVQSVTLKFRTLGGSAYTARTMTQPGGTGDRYAATIEGSRLVSPGIEYCVEATDGISTVSSGRAELPWQVVVDDRPVITTVTPVRGPSSGGTVLTIAGANFKAGARVALGGVPAADVVVLSANQIACTTPPHFPATADVVVSDVSGQNGMLARGFTYEVDVVSLGLPPTGGGRQSIVQVPLNAAAVNGLASASFTVTFNSAVLRARGVRTGTLTPGWGVVANTNTSGQLRASMASSGGTVSGSGVLAQLEFEVMGVPGTTTALALSEVSLNDGAVVFTLADGSFAVNLVYDVSGWVTFWKNGASISNVQCQLAGDRLYAGASVADGSYTVAGAETGAYTLRPSKSDQANGITAYDASLALQHDAQLLALSGPAAIAADVNGSGQVTAMDAFYMLQRSVGLIELPFPGAGVVWAFSPGQRTYPSLTSHQGGQDFLGILLGDPSGSWPGGGDGLGGGGGGGRGGAGGGDSPVLAALLTPAAGGASSNRARVLIKADPGTVYSVDAVLAFEPAGMQVVSVEAGSLASGMLLAANTNELGAVRCGLAAGTPVGGVGAVLEFEFDGVPSAVAIESLVVNEGGLTAEITTDLSQLVLGLVIGGCGVDGGGRLTFRWQGTVGSNYQVQTKARLTDAAWENVGVVVPGAEGESVFTDTTSGAGQERYYRVMQVE